MVDEPVMYEYMQFWIPFWGFVLLILVNGGFFWLFQRQHRYYRKLLELQSRLPAQATPADAELAVKLARLMRPVKPTEDNRNALRPLLQSVRAASSVPESTKQELSQLLHSKCVVTDIDHKG